MVVLIVVLVLVVVALCCRRRNAAEDDYEAWVVRYGVGFMCWFVVALILTAGAATWLSTTDKLRRMEGARATVDAAAGVASIDDAALQAKIVDYNAWLAGAQYWNRTPWGVFIPDEVDRVAPIRFGAGDAR